MTKPRTVSEYIDHVFAHRKLAREKEEFRVADLSKKKRKGKWDKVERIMKAFLKLIPQLTRLISLVLVLVKTLTEVSRWSGRS